MAHVLIMRAEDVRDLNPETLGTVAHPDYKARIERIVFIDVVAFDWNWPQYITRRYTKAELAEPG